MFAETAALQVVDDPGRDPGRSQPDAETRKAEISAAKLQLSDGGWFVQENAIQLFGGIGVTDEQDEGLFFKRLRVLNGLFGDADWHVGRFQSLKSFDAID